MKNILAGFVAVCMIIFSFSSFADIADPNVHDVTRCVKISGLSGVSDVVFVAYSESGKATAIVEGTCLPSDTTGLYAVDKTYSTQSGGVDNIDFSKFSVQPAAITNVQSYATSGKIKSEDITYSVAGSIGTNVVIYESKIVTKYSDSTADKIETFDAPASGLQ